MRGTIDVRFSLRSFFMTASRFILSSLVAALAFSPVTRAGASDLGSALVGGIIGGLIVN